LTDAALSQRLPVLGLIFVFQVCQQITVVLHPKIHSSAWLEAIPVAE